MSPQTDLGTGSSDTTGRNGTCLLRLGAGTWPSREVRLASASRFLSDSDAARTSSCSELLLSRDTIAGGARGSRSRLE